MQTRWFFRNKFNYSSSIVKFSQMAISNMKQVQTICIINLRSVLFPFLFAFAWPDSAIPRVWRPAVHSRLPFWVWWSSRIRRKLFPADTRSDRSDRRIRKPAKESGGTERRNWRGRPPVLELKRQDLRLKRKRHETNGKTENKQRSIEESG